MKTTLTIGLIGYGHFGKALAQKIEQTSTNQLIISTDKTQNIQIAKTADILIITVRPTQLPAVLNEIKPHLNPEAIILSFIGSIPATQIAQGIPNKVIRAMADIHFRQIIAQPNEITDELLKPISQNPLIAAKSEDDIDTFAVLIGCLPGVSAWHFAHNQNAQEWLNGYAQFIEQKLNISKTITWEITEEIRAKGNFQDMMISVATPGGITESLLLQLSKNPSTTFEELFQTGMKKIEEIKSGCILK